MKKTAIVVVHGVCPQPRYGIQDEFSSGLCDALNRIGHLNSKWDKAILWPTILKEDCTAADLHATAVRIYPCGEDGADPDQAEDAYDVFEGYWSPIDKNRTNVAGVLSWLLKTLFVPLNGYAKLWADWRKTTFDLGYVTLALLLVVGLLSFAFAFAAKSWYVYAALATCSAVPGIDWPHLLSWRAECPVPGFLSIFSDPMKISGSIGPGATTPLVVALIGAYAGWQLLFSWVMELQRVLSRVRRSLSADRNERTGWRFFFQLGLLVTAGLCAWILARMHLGPSGYSALVPGAALVAAVGFLKSSLALIQGFFVNFIGDVQIYCTHDENSKFYELRKKIVETVETVILEVLRSPHDRPPRATIPSFDKDFIAAQARKFEPYYDAVFIAGHSLGSTIALDALLNVHELVEEDGVDTRAWRLLRGFITFGTALEKTKFFFDVRNPSFSARVQQWRDGVHGHLFTDDEKVLAKPPPDEPKPPLGIYWANYWYSPDIVANEIKSYRSQVTPGKTVTISASGPTHAVCKNALLPSAFFRPSWHIWVHGDYLGDAHFWDDGVDRKNQPYFGAVSLIK